jgi:hypothetical protein
MLAYNITGVVPLHRIKNKNDLRHENQILLDTITSISLIDHSTVEIRIDEDVEFELTHARELNDRIAELGGNRKYYQLTVFGTRSIPSKEARIYCTSPEGSRYKHAEAIVVNSLSQKMVFNFMINVERPSVRTKLFTSEEEAKEWLNSLKD